jgi:putative transposase
LRWGLSIIVCGIKMPKLKHYDNWGTVRFITFGTHQVESRLLEERTFCIVARHIDSIRRKYKLKLLGYVLMPDHVHMVVFPPEGVKLGRIIGELKSKSAREIFSIYPPADSEFTRSFWHKRCYDHNCRTTETVKEKINYCHLNPVRRELVAEPGEWSWSSYNWYMGDRDVPLEMDEFGL